MAPSILYVFLSEAFTELALISPNSDKKKAVLKHEVRLSSQETLGRFLHRFLEGQDAVEKVIIGCRRLKKLLDTKLGGSVGQVVPKGFENWMRIRQPLSTSRLDLTAKRAEHLANPDLVFGIDIRWDQRGQMLQEPTLSELETVVKSLKESEIQKVCLHFLHGSKNLEQQEKISRYFVENGFSVFERRPLDENSDEIPRWRATVLDACLVSGAEELRDYLRPIFIEQGIALDKIFWAGTRNLNIEKELPLESLFVSSQGLVGLTQGQSDIQSTVVLLDRERWRVVPAAQQKFSYWESPWGRAELLGPGFFATDIQPTCELMQSEFDGFEFGVTEFGFEPGPMTLGRAVRPLAIDAIYFTHSDLIPQGISAAGIEKFKNLLKTFAKGSSRTSAWSLEETNQFIYQKILQKLAVELRFKSKTERLIMTGSLAPAIAPDLKNYLRGFDIQVDPQANLCQINSLREDQWR